MCCDLRRHATLRTGTIPDLGLLRLLSELHLSRFTGQLLLDFDEARRLLFLREGAVVHVAGEQEGGRLGEMLVELGALSAKNHAFSLAIKPPDGLRYGSIILRYGMASAQAIAAALREQMRRRLLPLLLAAGAFELAAGEHHEGLLADGTPVRLDLRQVLYEGMIGLEPAQLMAIVAPILEEPVRLREDAAPDAFGLGDGDAWVPEHLRTAPTTPADLAQLPRGRRALGVAGALWLGGALDVGAAALAAPAPRATPSRPEVPTAAAQQPGAARAAASDPGAEGQGADPDLLRIDLLYLAAHLEREDLFGILGLPLNTHTAVIQRALAAALAAYADDSLARHGLSEHADTARAVRGHLQHAADQLREGALRQDYLDGLLMRRAAAVDPALAQARGERLGARARVLLQRGRFAAAALDAEAALRLLPGRRDLDGLRAYARYAAGHISAARAERTLAEARSAEPACADLHYLAGLFFSREGRTSEAVAALGEALARDPGHREAAQLAAELRGKKQAQAKVLEPITLIEALRHPVGPGVIDALRRPLSGLAPEKEAAPAPVPDKAAAPAEAAEGAAARQAPVSLLEVLKQPVGAGLLSAMRRPLSGIVPARPAPEAPAPTEPTEKKNAPKE